MKHTKMQNSLIMVAMCFFLLPLAMAASVTIQTPDYSTSVLKDSTFTVSVPIQASDLSAEITATLTPTTGNGLTCPSTSDCQKSVSQSGGTATFTLRADTAGTKSSPFTVSASSQSTQATPVTASTAITVSEAPTWSIDLAKSLSTVSAGSTMDLTLTITITGGTLESASVVLTNPSGWSIITGSSSYSLGDLSASTTASWTVRADSPAASNEFSVTVTGTNALSSKTDTATVTSAGGSGNAGGTTGGSSGSSGPGLALGTKAMASKTFASLLAGNASTFNVGNDKIPVHAIIVTALNKYMNVGLIISAIHKPASLIAPPEGVTYEYMTINATNLPSGGIKDAALQFKIPLSWFTNNSLDKNTVKLQRYTTAWEGLTTRLLREDAKHIYYEATTPGFSYFAITAAKLAAAAAPTEEPAQAPASAPSAAPAAEEPSASGQSVAAQDFALPGLQKNKLLLALVLIGAVACVALFAVGRMKNSFGSVSTAAKNDKKAKK